MSVVFCLVSASFGVALLVVGIYAIIRIGHDATRCTGRYIDCSGYLVYLDKVPIDCFNCSCLTLGVYRGFDGPPICTEVH